MSTIQIDLSRRQVQTGQPCTTCGGQTRLIGIEPHPMQPRTDLRTFECLDCEAVTTVELPIAV